jgi:segregation and condensation protein B
MDTRTLKNIVEAALLAAGRPLTLEQLQALFLDHERPDRADIKTAIAALEADYADRGLRIFEVASGWRIQAREELSEWLSRLWQDRPARYSRALLETLALIAYRQPITRGEIEDVRGVSVSSNIMRTLMERGWVRIVGHRDVPGRPGIYATTREFLDYFGLKSLDQLPPLAEVRDLESIGVELDLELADLPVLAAEQLAEADDEAPAWPPEEAGDHEEATDADPQQDSSRP